MENGTPVIVVRVEGSKEAYYIPFTLSSTAELENVANGNRITVEVDGNYVLIPVVEDDEIEIERVCISDFDVKEVKDDGQIVLVSEVNPRLRLLWRLIVGAVILYEAYHAIVDIGTTHLSMRQGCRLWQ